MSHLPSDLSSNPTPIIFFGSDAICLPFLEYIQSECGEICTLRAVVSQPDRRKGRGKQVQANPVAAWARAQGVELLQPEKPDRELADRIQAEGVALCFVMAYGHFLPKSVREAAVHGMVNFHGSLLPAYRGASPVETALALGDSETGVSLMAVAREMDAGGVADVERVRIEDADTGPSLRAKIGEAVVPLMRRNIAAALRGELNFEPQDLTQVSFCRKIFKEDAALDFDQPAGLLDARLRAFTPWPGGYFDYEGERIKVGRVAVHERPSDAKPGTLLTAEASVLVACATGVVELCELQRAGGRMMPAADFLRGFPLAAGVVLASTPSESLVSSL